MLTLATISGTLLVTRIMPGIGFESQLISFCVWVCVPVPYYLFFLFLCSFFKKLFIVLVSAIYQLESLIGICMSPPSLTSLPLSTPFNPFRLSQSTGLSSLQHTASSQWLSVLYMVMYMFQCYSQSVPPSPCPTVSTCLFSMSASLLLPNK